MVPRSYTVLDLETTGIDPARDEIIEIAALRVEEGEIRDTWQTLVRPTIAIPSFVTELTGINEAMVSSAPRLEEVLPSFCRFLGDLPILGHNVRFDAAFIQTAQGFPLPNVLLDSAEAARVIFPVLPGYSLGKLASSLHLEVQPSHRALDDTTTTHHLWEKLWQEVSGWDVFYLTGMARFASRVNWAYSGLLEEVLEKSARKFPRSGRRGGPVFLADEKDTAHALDNWAAGGRERRRTNQGVSDNLPGRGELQEMFSPGGPLASALPGFEHRAGQVNMAGAVWDAFAGENFLLLEAGTGTGKSLAYLLPAITWARASGEKVVIATNTINLQEQLWFKDIPLLREAAPFTFEAALAKGKSNYLCLNRWEHRITGTYGLEGAPEFWMKIWRWVSVTSTGDVGEINLPSNLQWLWNEVAAASETCSGSSCPWHNTRCFYQKARREAEKADIVVVNHSLLLADVQTDNRVLPSYNYLVIDEAHNLADVASEQLSRHAAAGSLMRWYSNFERFTRSLLRKNLLPKLDPAGLEALQKAVEQVPLLKEQTAALSEMLCRWARREGQGDNENYRFQVRLTPTRLDKPGWHPVRTAADNLLLNFGLLCQKTRLGLDLWDAGEGSGDDILRREFLFLAGEGERLREALGFLLDVADDDWVYWVECPAEGDDFVLRAAPLEVGELLAENLYKKKKSIVFTSATLSVAAEFGHYIQTSGLAGFPVEKVATHFADSPFAYDRQVLLCVPQDLPDPYQNREASFTSAVSRFLEGLVEITSGKTLVLFTSHRMLQAVYRELKPFCRSRGINLLGHGLDGSRARLVEALRNGGSTILFGASSFWEGVDIPGENLSCVVVVKIPFAPPTAPTVEARIEALDRQKKDSFKNFSLPQAVIKIKQGFGRLVRSPSDRGVVIILDRRVTSKNYGRLILESLPVSSYCKGNSLAIFQKIKKWLLQTESN